MSIMRVLNMLDRATRPKQQKRQAQPARPMAEYKPNRGLNTPSAIWKPAREQKPARVTEVEQQYLTRTAKNTASRASAYVQAVNARVRAETCERGHQNCALRKDGACSKDAHTEMMKARIFKDYKSQGPAVFRVTGL